LAASGKNPAYLAAQILKAGVQNGSSRVEHNRPIWSQLFVFGAHCRAHTALNSVSLHSLSDSPGYGKSKLGQDRRFRVPQAKGSEIAAGHTDARLINRAELGRFEKPPIARE
jgi:hypothetical protein